MNTNAKAVHRSFRKNALLAIIMLARNLLYDQGPVTMADPISTTLPFARVDEAVCINLAYTSGSLTDVASAASALICTSYSDFF